MNNTRPWSAAPRPSDPGYKASPRRRFSIRQRLFGEIRDRGGQKLGLISRLLYEVVFTDDPYYSQLDDYLSSQEQHSGRRA